MISAAPSSGNHARKQLQATRELQIPPRGTVMARDLFNHPEHGNGVDLQASKRLGTRHAIQTCLEHGIDYGARQAPLSSASAACSRIIGAISFTLSNNESAVTFVAIGAPLTSHYSNISQSPLLAQDAHTCNASDSQDEWSLQEFLPKHRRVHDDIDRVHPVDGKLAQSGVFIEQVSVRGLILAVELPILRRVVALDPCDPELVANSNGALSCLASSSSLRGGLDRSIR